MSTSVQSIQDIAPIQKGKGTGAVDPVQADYDKGKELLGKDELAQAAVALHNAPARL